MIDRESGTTLEAAVADILEYCRVPGRKLTHGHALGHILLGRPVRNWHDDASLATALSDMIIERIAYWEQHLDPADVSKPSDTPEQRLGKALITKRRKMQPLSLVRAYYLDGVPKEDMQQLMRLSQRSVEKKLQTGRAEVCSLLAQEYSAVNEDQADDPVDEGEDTPALEDDLVDEGEDAPPLEDDPVDEGDDAPPLEDAPPFGKRDDRPTRPRGAAEFIRYLGQRLVEEEQVYQLTSTAEYAPFAFIGVREKITQIELVAFVVADGMTFEDIVRLPEQFFVICRQVPTDLRLKRRGRQPNGILCFVFEHGCPLPLLKILQKQTKVSHSGSSGAIIVSWVLDLQARLVHTHSNPVSLVPPVVVFPQFAFPSVAYLQDLVEAYPAILE